MADYALSYTNKKMQPHSDNAFEAFTEIGNAYVNLAFEEPNLFKFLFLDGSSGYYMGGMEAMFGVCENKAFIKSISGLFSITVEQAAEYAFLLKAGGNIDDAMKLNNSLE